MGAVCTYGRDVQATEINPHKHPANIHIKDKNNGGAERNSSVKTVTFNTNPKPPTKPQKRTKPKRRGYQKEKPKDCVPLEEGQVVPNVRCWLLTKQGWHLAKIIHVETKKVKFELDDGFGTKRIIFKNQVKTRVLQIYKPKVKSNIYIENIPVEEIIERATSLKKKMEEAENYEELVILDGFMIKLNPHGKSQERYFKLKTDSVLYYYQHQNDTTEKGHLPLEDMLDIKTIPDKGDGSFYFQIEMQDSSRLWKFGCLEESIRDKWVEVIKQNQPIQKIMKEGLLFKATESTFATGHVRYFVLKYNLEYYKDEKKENYLGKIDINNIETEKNEEIESGGTKSRKFGIKFHTTGPSGRVWRLYAESTKQRKEWVQAIDDQRELNSLKHKTTFGIQASRIYSTKSSQHGTN